MPAYTNTVTSTQQDFTWTGTTGSFASISLIPGIEYNAQLEVERQFALDRSGNPTIAAFLGNEFVSTQDKRQVFVIPNQYITYNTTNKTITGFTLSNYNYTYYLTTDLTQTTPLTILVPNISTSVNTLFTVKRKSISNQALVTWADGGKLTSSQLNLQTQQLLFLAQETADRINTELSNATDIAYAIADGAITYTKILGDGVNAWNFASPIITISPTSNLHATTRLYTLNSIYNHGVITKDDTAPSSSAVDILETAATAGNSGIWFDPKLGQLQVWAGNAWVALVGVPLSTNNIVDIGSTQTITGAKTFSSATTLSSTLGVTGATVLSNSLNVGAATQLGTTLLVYGATTLSSTLGVTGAATIQGLTVGKGGGTIVSNTAFGTSALNANTTGTANTAVGNVAMSANTTGIQNCAFGSGALSLNTIGYSNTAVGEASQYSNISGYGNVGVGNNTLLLNTAYQNTAVGTNSMYSNTTGYQNTAVGVSALHGNTIGSHNCAFGSLALLVNNMGSNNSAFGYSALASNTTGTYNDAFGHNALTANTTGLYNSAFGYAALASNTTGGANNAFGYNALTANTTGTNNNAFGWRALSSNTTGTYNDAFGQQALQDNTIGLYNNAFGYAALVLNTTGSQNCAFGVTALYSTSGTTNSAFGYAAGSSITTGSNNTCIGYNAQAPSAAISNTVTLGDSSINNLRCQDTTISAVSDRRDKTDIIDIPTGLEFITAVRPVSFVWNMRDGGIVGVQAFGFIAQELLEAQTTVGITVPKLVTTTNPDKYEVAPAALLPVMVKAIQELKAELEATKLRITQLENIP